MKIEYKEGDLFSSAIPVIVHGCNTQGVMGSGVAKIVREKFPEAYIKYFQIFEERGLRLGEIIPVMCERQNDSTLIINAMTQTLYGRDGGRYASYDAISDVMVKINKLCVNHNIQKIALPKIGAGFGGANWDIIEKIIEVELINVQPVVYTI